jgi:hypothetical protein
MAAQCAAKQKEVSMAAQCAAKQEEVSHEKEN